MKNETTTEASQVATVHPPQNIDGFFRGSTSAPLRPATPPASDTITVLSAPSPLPKPLKKHERAINHAKAHSPQPAHTQQIRIQSGVKHSQKLTVHRTPANINHTKAHATQESRILMRKAVKRPDPSFRVQAGTVAAIQHAVPSLIVPKKSVLSLDEQRLMRAQSSSRSPQIAHHSTPKPGVTPSVAPIPVAPQPAPGQTPAPTAPAPIPTNKPTDIFEHALANASHYVDIHAHHRAYRRKVRTHVASMLAGSTLLIAVAGFVAFQNSPSLQFRVASARAGVSAHLPNFAALGYSYDGVKAQSGKLTVGFKKGNTQYHVTQQATNLSNDDMIQNIGATDATGAPDYAAVQAGTTTVYKFGNTTATWVSNGKWYTVTSNSVLDNTQLQTLVKNI